MMTWWRMVMILTAGVPLTGCISMAGVNPAKLNRALDQTWTVDTSPPASCFNLTSGVTCLLPGMKLRIEQSSGQSVGNAAVPVITSFEWVVPEPDALTREDLFVLSYLMTAAYSKEKSGNASECYEAWLNRPEEFSTSFYVHLLEKMSVQWDMLDLSGKPSAFAVQKWMRWAPPTPPQNSAAFGQELIFEMPPIPGDNDCSHSTTFLAFDHGSAWQALTDAPATIPQVQPTYPAPPNLPYYRPNITIGNPRSLITVFIPVTIDGVRRYVSIDSSLADLEREAGLQVAGVSRLRQLAPDDIAIEPAVKRFEIVLTDFGHVLRSPDTVVMPRACVGDILLAPGDEVSFADTPIDAAPNRSATCVN